MYGSKFARFVIALGLGVMVACGGSPGESPESYALTYSAGAGGYVDGEASQLVEEGQSGSPVTAVADEGHTFEAWNDGVLTPTRVEHDVRANLSVRAQFTPNEYTLTYLAGEGGSVDGLTEQAVLHGRSGTSVTAVPAEGYVFNRWSDGLGTPTRTDENVNANLTVTAEFVEDDAELEQFTLTYLAGDGGSIVGVSPQVVDEGADGSEILAVPDEGQEFVGWSDGSTDNPRADLSIAANLTVTANFALRSFSLTYVAGAGGSITGESSQEVSYGGSGTLVTAVPDSGYVFLRWSDGLGTASRAESNVTSALTVTAEFVEDDVVLTQYTLTYAAGANGSISGASPQVVNEGSNGSAVTAVPDVGHHFVAWSDGSTQNPRTELNVMADVSVTATFAINVYTLTYSAAYGGEVNGPLVQMVPHGGDGDFVNVAPTVEGYVFAGWSDGLPDADRRDTGVIGDITVTASFMLIDIRAEYYVATAGGSIVGSAEQLVPYGSDAEMVTAVPDEGYVFVRWSDDLTTPSRLDTNLRAHLTVLANFEKIPGQFTLTYTAGAGGSILGDAVQVVAEGEAGTAVTAVPDIGYEFEQWSDGVTSAIRTDVDVFADVTVEASFRLKSYLLTYSADPPEGGYVVPPNYFVEHGSDGPIATAVENEGFVFVGWSDGLTSITRQELEVVAPASFVAQFEALGTTTLTYLAGPGGSLQGPDVQMGYVGSAAGVVEAIPSEGYRFVSWSDGSTTAQRQDLFPESDSTLTATFELLTHEVAIASDSFRTLVTPSGTQFVTHGESLELTALPKPGFALDSISGCGGVQTAYTFVTAPITGYCVIVVETSDVPSPSGLGATAGEASATLTWGGGAGAESFNLYLATEPGIDATNYASLEGGARYVGVTSPFTVTGLRNDVTYYFVVTAAVAMGESLPSNEVSAVPLAPALVRPPLNDTGIEFCGVAAGGNNLPCLGTEADGQDAHHGRDVPGVAAANLRVGSGSAGFRFTKLSHEGMLLSEDAAFGSAPLDWGCTRDNVTGLVWELKTDDAADLRAASHRYAWYDTNASDGNVGSAGDAASCAGTLVGCNTEAYVNAVNAAGLCGHSDWRLPTAEELESIVDYGREAPAIDTYFFPHAASAQTWSRTVSASTSANAWFVHFDFGRVNDAAARTATHAVRLVRGPSPLDASATRYEIVGLEGEIVRDLVTGLEWQRCSVGQTWNATSARCDGVASTFTNQEARALTAEGGFVLPSLRQLKSLVYCSSAGPTAAFGKSDDDVCPAGYGAPTIFREIFPDTPEQMAWSSTDHPLFASSWRVSFTNGSADGSANTNLMTVRLVRSVTP